MKQLIKITTLLSAYILLTVNAAYAQESFDDSTTLDIFWTLSNQDQLNKIDRYALLWKDSNSTSGVANFAPDDVSQPSITECNAVTKHEKCYTTRVSLPTKADTVDITLFANDSAGQSSGPSITNTIDLKTFPPPILIKVRIVRDSAESFYEIQIP